MGAREKGVVQNTGIRERDTEKWVRVNLPHYYIVLYNK